MPELNVEDWKTHTTVRYQRENIPSVAEITLMGHFWDILSTFSETQRSRLLQFVTGSSSVPIEGFKALTSSDGQIRWFTLQFVELNTDCISSLYPHAHTCFNRLEIPLYDTKADLLQHLTSVRKTYV